MIHGGGLNGDRINGDSGINGSDLREGVRPLLVRRIRRVRL
jgi:hypothetical protein